MSRRTVLLLLVAALLVVTAECHRRGGGWRARRKDRLGEDDRKPKELAQRNLGKDTSWADDDNYDDDDDADDNASSTTSDDELAEARQARRHGRRSHSFTARWQHGLPGWLSVILDDEASENDDEDSQAHIGVGGTHDGPDASTALPDVETNDDMPSWRSNHEIKIGNKALGRFNWHAALGLPPARLVPHFGQRNKGNWYQGSNVCRSVTGQLPEGDDEDTKQSGNSTRTKSVACFQIASVRKCHTTIIDSDGNKYTQQKVERCCSGYTLKGNKCVTDEKAEDITAAMKKHGAATFASILTELAMQPEARAETTTFAPTDRALEEYFTSQGLNVTAVIVNPQHKNIAVKMKELLQAHKLPRPEQIGGAFDGQLFKTEHPHPNASIRVSTYKPVYRKPMVNCAPLVKSDIATKNGLLNVVDRVLLPVTESLSSKLNSDVRLARFAAVLKKAFGENLSSLDDSERPMTIFAPTNEAMDEFEQLTNGSMAAACLQRLLRQHIVSDMICTEAISYRARAISNTGREILLERRQQAIMVAGTSRVVEGDIVATNGVIHVIDKVIFDNDNVVDLQQKMTAGNLLGFLRLMDRAGVNAKEISNVTLLVPPTSALQQLVEQKTDKDERHDEAAIVNYHIIRGQLTCDAFRESRIQTTHGVPLILQTYALFPLIGNVHTANCVKVMKKNTLTCNGIIHELEKVLEPPTKTVYQMIRSTAGLEQFAALLEQTTYKQKLDTLTDDMFTVYSPNNAAMRSVETMIDAEKEQFVARHVAYGYKCCAGVPELFSTSVDMVGQHRIWLTKEMPSGNIKIKGNAKIVRCDLVSTNGVVHVIDQAVVTRSQPFGLGRLPLSIPKFPPARGFWQP